MKEITAYNPTKGRHVTIEVRFDQENTTWFKDELESAGIHSIADTDAGLLICEADYTIPLLAQELTRVAIKFDPHQAREIIKQTQ